MSAQHTPGPWATGHIGTSHLWVGPDHTQQPTALVPWDMYGARGNARANAALIAAAPEMLEVLHQYVSDLRYPPTGDSIQRRIERVEAVIAKALGKGARQVTTPDWFACPKCVGFGEIRGPEHGMPFFPCAHCDGVGLVDKDGDPVPYEVAAKADAA